MNQFNFSETAGASQNTSRPKLKGNQVHEVTILARCGKACGHQQLLGLFYSYYTYMLGFYEIT